MVRRKSQRSDCPPSESGDWVLVVAITRQHKVGCRAAFSEAAVQFSTTAKVADLYISGKPRLLHQPTFDEIGVANDG